LAVIVDDHIFGSVINPSAGNTRANVIPDSVIKCGSVPTVASSKIDSLKVPINKNIENEFPIASKSRAITR